MSNGNMCIHHHNLQYCIFRMICEQAGVICVSWTSWCFTNSIFGNSVSWKLVIGDQKNLAEQESDDTVCYRNNNNTHLKQTPRFYLLN